ncbi:D-isomer specific 2-hydroxyacid dehydrogenase, NAD-binding [Ectocarpus siliculosus]|uniref:D-isomer specific 2-hydroxyacid dehydrogenase, NAD-binding n=1 Tax=Ectocarpus siliculosus TaxID=2880 RepID=D8LT75_ECTSI|nr:D-isomer specific 2-hydroxyacid dehydrogenase, NAD-binding [Ectocarpus siliculosus]|eukprot:CBN77946.1 D-isomer specific 2-hydroxyacid dehydrogenase, NAD-binding [Ectocarpus siliculosus]
MGYPSCRLGSAAGQASIIVVAEADDPTLVELERLPKDASEVLFRGSTIEEFSTPEGKRALAEANVLLNCIGTKDLLSQLFPLAPKLAWVHSRLVGVDAALFPALIEADDVSLTNARGLFASALAEHVVLSCLYFAKDVDRWKRNQKCRKWERYHVAEVSRTTLGIIGYGDIGRAAAVKAKAMGMKIIAQRRRPELSIGDGIVDQVFGAGQVGDVIAQSDYILVAAALTPATVGMVGAEELSRAKPHAVIISIGRGPLIDEGAMTQMLQDGRLRGAALDVFTTEPLPTDSPLWGLENVLLSPHNADLAAHYLSDSVRKFAENVDNFVKGDDMSIHVVNKKAGY